MTESKLLLLVRASLPCMCLRLAADKGMSSRFSAISLGQGQGPKAAALIAEAQASGCWVVLQNCHLAPSWMPTLDRIVEEMNPEAINPKFRCVAGLDSSL
jgi:dynein heavy chain